MNNSQKKLKADSLKLQAIKAADNNIFLTASFFAAQALKLYGEAGDKAGVSELKNLVVGFNKKSEDQIQEINFSVDVDEETKNGLQELIHELTKADTLAENFERISKSRAIVPRFATAQKNAKDIVPITAQFATHMSVGEDGHLNSFNDFEKDWLRDHYNFQMDISMNLLNAAFSELITKNQFTEENVMEAILAKEIFNNDYLFKLEATLERRLAGDYFSALHLLTPLVEKTFIILSNLVGLDTYTYNGRAVSTRNSNLSLDMLRSKEYQETWGNDFCYMLGFFLLEPNAYRFRHKIAHGDVTMAECNFTSFNILFFFLIKMIMMIEVTPKEETSERK